MVNDFSDLQNSPKTHKLLKKTNQAMNRVKMLYAQEMQNYRKEDARRKILSGASFNTAGLEYLTSAQKLGILLEAKDRLSENPTLETYWHMLGDRKLKEIELEKSRSKLSVNRLNR